MQVDVSGPITKRTRINGKPGALLTFSATIEGREYHATRSEPWPVAGERIEVLRAECAREIAVRAVAVAAQGV